MIENESHDRKYLTTIQVNKLRKSRFTAKFCFISQFIVDLSQYRWHENIEQQSRSACSENRDSLQNHVSFQNLSWLCQSIVDMFLSIYPMGGHWHRDCFCFWRFASVQRIICLLGNLLVYSSSLELMLWLSRQESSSYSYLYTPILTASLVRPRDIKFSEAWLASESDDAGKDINQRAWKRIQIFIEKKSVLISM